jgi:choline transport protein
MSLLAIIGAGWNICNSWAGISATLALSIMSGGSVTLVYGVIVIFIVVGSSAISLAELASVYPTAGGQYHWTNILAPKAWSRSLVSLYLHLCVDVENDQTRNCCNVVILGLVLT